MLMIDLCCGMKGASERMKAHGWQVITLDNDRRFKPDILSDVRRWNYVGPRPDLIWGSPPCSEYSRTSMPWLRPAQSPDMSIFFACLNIIHKSDPRFWVIENVRGAARYFLPYIGKPAYIYGPFYLWGHFPALPKFQLRMKKKESYTGKQRELRAKIPQALSEKLAVSIESQKEFELTLATVPA